MSIREPAAKITGKLDRAKPTADAVAPKPAGPSEWLWLAALLIALLAEPFITALGSAVAMATIVSLFVAGRHNASNRKRVTGPNADIQASPRPPRDVPSDAVTANPSGAQVASCRAAGTSSRFAKPLDRELERSTIAPRPSGPLELPTTAIDAPQGAHSSPPPTGFSDVPTLGIATLLDIFDGDVASVSDIFTAALTSIEADLARITVSAAAGDMQTVAVAAHRMKGTSGSIRSQRIMEITATFQDAAKHDPRRVDAALLLGLRGAVAEFRSDVEAFRSYLAAARAV